MTKRRRKSRRCRRRRRNTKRRDPHYYAWLQMFTGVCPAPVQTLTEEVLQAAVATIVEHRG